MRDYVLRLFFQYGPAEDLGARMSSLGVQDMHSHGNHSNSNGYGALVPLHNLGASSRLVQAHVSQQQAYAAMHGQPYANWKTSRTGGGSVSHISDRTLQVRLYDP